MAQLHLIIGPVGAGKSTFARRLCREQRALLLTLDEWMTTLFGADERPASGRMAWYRERASRCVEQIWRTALTAVRAGAPVVLEIGLIQRDERLAFYERVRRAGVALTVHVIDAPREVRRARVLERNDVRGETFSMVVPPDIFELASDLWQPPDDDECDAVDVRVADAG